MNYPKFVLYLPKQTPIHLRPIRLLTYAIVKQVDEFPTSLCKFHFVCSEASFASESGHIHINGHAHTFANELWKQ